MTKLPSLELRALVRREVGYLPANCQVIGDLLGAEAALAPFFKGVDVVVHLAGANEVASLKDPDRALTTTIAAAQRVAHLGTAAGVRRFVFVSTIHVYGRAITDGATLSEETVPLPQSIYSIARLASEYLFDAARGPDTETVVFRVTNAVGAPCDPEVDRWSLVTNDLCRSASLRDRVELRTDGMQWRDFVALEDVTSFLQVAASDDSVPSGTYNLGSGQPVTVRALAVMVQDAFEELTGHRPELRAPDVRPDPPQPYWVRVDRLAQLGLRPGTSLQAAVMETAKFCLEHRGQL